MLCISGAVPSLGIKPSSERLLPQISFTGNRFSVSRPISAFIEGFLGILVIILEPRVVNCCFRSYNEDSLYSNFYYGGSKIMEKRD